MIPGGIPETLQNTVHLQYPTADAIKAAYRELPKKGSVFLTATGEELADTLLALEQTGFYGLQINPQGLAARNVEIRGFKGKQGPCFETGRSAQYKGAAIAALDDDNHLIVGDMRVCEKTGSLYAQQPYEELVAVTEADAELLEKMDLEPVPFDCDTLERDAAIVSKEISEDPATDRAPVLYCGPFRALVLADGTIARRGQTTTVPSAQLGDLKDEGFVKLGSQDPVGEAEFFQKRYAEDGAACLLGTLPLAASFAEPVSLNLDALTEADGAMTGRLRHVIERDDKQFILTGSDPRIQFGCCPSDDVFQANRLVEAGILTCYRAPTPPDACPTTIYAFRGEIAAKDGRPDVTIDGAFRQQVLGALAKKPEGSAAQSGGAARYLRMALILFLVVAVLFGLINKLKSDRGLPYGFVVEANDQFIAAFYHPDKRCDECETTERLLKETFSEHELPNYRMVVGNYEKNPTVEETLDLFTSTMVLWSFDGAKPNQQPKRLMWALDYENLKDEAAFKKRLAEDLQAYAAELDK